MVLSFPSSPTLGQIVVTGGQSWRWDGVKWSLVSSVGFSGSVGFTGSPGFGGFVGSAGFQGSRGFQGSLGGVGFAGSAGFGAFQGSVGFQGSQSAGGFVGSIGFRGSVGDIGFQGSTSYGGFTGSVGATGFRGSLGFQGSFGFQGSPGFQGSFGFQGSLGQANVVFGDNPPANPNTGLMWLDTNNIVLSVWSGQANNWIGINGGAAGAQGYQGSRGDQTFMISLGQENLSVPLGNPVFTMRSPYALTITNARASLAANGSSGNTIVQINVNSTSIFGSNNLMINSGSKTSVGHPNTIVIANPSVPDDAEITFNITASSTNARGLKVVIYYT